MMKCPKCAATERVKNGKMNSKQRYKCKSCGCNYTQSSKYRIPLEKRTQAIELYLEGTGFRGIERLTAVSHVTVMRWVKALEDDIEKFRKQDDKPIDVIELDELWHYLARFRRKIFCYSKSINIIKATLTIFFTPNWKEYLCQRSNAAKGL